MQMLKICQNELEFIRLYKLRRFLEGLEAPVDPMWDSVKHKLILQNGHRLVTSTNYTVYSTNIPQYMQLDVYKEECLDRRLPATTYRLVLDYNSSIKAYKLTQNYPIKPVRTLLQDLNI